MPWRLAKVVGQPIIFMIFINTVYRKELNLMNNYAATTGALLNALHNQKPLVHHITNYVTVNDCANIVLAIGASPIMADDLDEVEAIAAIASALVLNIGTLNQRTIAAMLAAGKKANELQIPVVLDPVGAGASQLRNETTRELLKQIQVSVLRGNMSEIRFVSGLAASTKGVDASEADLENGSQNGGQIAQTLAQKLHCVVAITGATDYVSDGIHNVSITNGHPMLSGVTGTGCMCTSLIGAFCGSTANYFAAAVAGVICMGVAGEMAFAAAGDRGAGSFRTALIDSISKLDQKILEKLAKVNEN
jgi:hydroxyethylthiazole kinase